MHHLNLLNLFQNALVVLALAWSLLFLVRQWLPSVFNALVVAAAKISGACGCKQLAQKLQNAQQKQKSGCNSGCNQCATPCPTSNINQPPQQKPVQWR